MASTEQSFHRLTEISTTETSALFEWSLPDEFADANAKLSRYVVASVASSAMEELSKRISGGNTAPVSITSDHVGSEIPSSTKIALDAKVDRKTRTIVFLSVDATASIEGKDEPVLTATGVFRIV